MALKETPDREAYRADIGMAVLMGVVCVILLAVTAAGKKISKETVTEMFHAADYDRGGDIDYSEFADVIKGVKASKAAFILERGVRRQLKAHRESQRHEALAPSDSLCSAVHCRQRR